MATPGGAELAEQADKVGLGDAELDVASTRRLVPVDQRLGVVGEPVAPLAHRPDAGLVDPAAQVRGAGHVRAHGHHALGHTRRVVHQVDEEAAEGLLSRLLAAVLAAQRRRHLRRRARLRVLAREHARGRGRELALRAGRVERRPGLVRVGAELPRELGELLLGEERRVVLRVALDRQRPALDRVGEDHGRAVVLHRPVRLDQLPDVVAAEVAEARAQLIVAQLGHERSQPSVPPRQALAQLRRVGSQQPLVLLVRHLVDAAPEVLSALPLEQRVEPAAVLHGRHLPAGGLEHSREPAEGDVGHHPVERLPVEVDDPQDLAEPRHPRVRDRLPHGALVQLGVAQQRDLAAARRRLEPVMLEVPARDRRPDRRGRPDADGAGGEVDRVRVLRPAWIALQPAERAQRLEVGLLEQPQQVVDRVQHGRRVRLHRHAVLGAQLGEPQRGHEAHHRRARSLVAAHLHAGAVLAHPIRVMHDRGREPEHAPLNGLECVEVRRSARLRRRFRGRDTTQVERFSHLAPSAPCASGSCPRRR